MINLSVNISRVACQTVPKRNADEQGQARKISSLDYYSGGMVIPDRNFSYVNYGFGYQGSLKNEDIKGAGNSYSTFFRENDPRLTRWWSIDIKSSFSPGLSPYTSMANNPIMFIDPYGDKEYKSEAQYAKKNIGKTWENDKGKGDWLKVDRMGNTDTWKSANAFNLQQDRGYNEYSTISERRDFYEWIQTTTEKQGSETKWAGAATIVARQIAQVEDPLIAAIVGENVVKFALAGNRAIFNDVFGDLRHLYNIGNAGTPLKGEAAKLWDANILYKEQFLIVQPIYQVQNAETLLELSKMAKGEGLYAVGFIFQEELKFEGDISNPQDRYDHGMNKVVPYYNKWKFSSPSDAIRLTTY